MNASSTLSSPGRLVAAVGALAAAGAGAAALRGLFLGYPVARLLEKPFLSRKEQAIVASLADAFFPPGGPIPLSGTDAGLVEYMDDYCKQLPVGQGRLVRLLFVFLEHAPWLFGPRRQRFSSLSLDDRIAVLERMRTSPIYFRRIAFLSMRTMLSMGYLAHPEVARRIGMTANNDPYGIGARRAAQ
jgi:hypothetical protein